VTLKRKKGKDFVLEECASIVQNQNLNLPPSDHPRWILRFSGTHDYCHVKVLAHISSPAQIRVYGSEANENVDQHSSVAWWKDVAFFSLGDNI
jgi:hypothetical protein